MSQPYARYLHPFEATPRPAVEPEVEKTILASLCAGGRARPRPGEHEATGRSPSPRVRSTLQ